MSCFHTPITHLVNGVLGFVVDLVDIVLLIVFVHYLDFIFLAMDLFN